MWSESARLTRAFAEKARLTRDRHAAGFELRVYAGIGVLHGLVAQQACPHGPPAGKPAQKDEGLN
jgi:hypothetical protein